VTFWGVDTGGICLDAEADLNGRISDKASRNTGSIYR
jgi:hypothetical protein